MGGGAGPLVRPRPPDHFRADGVAFDVAVHREKMIVFLDWERPKPPLPDMAAAVVILVIAAHVRGGQPHHVGAVWHDTCTACKYLKLH